MSKQWFPSARCLLAVLLVVSASVLALPLIHKDPGWSSMAPGVSAGQSSSKKELLSAKPWMVTSAGPSVSTERAEALPPEAFEDYDLVSDALPNHPVPLGTPGASGRVTSGPAPSAQAKPEALRTPKSQPASSMAGPGPSSLLALSLSSTASSSQLSSLSPPPSSPSLSPPPSPALPPSSSPSPAPPASLPSSSPASPTPASSFSPHTASPPVSLPRQLPSPPLSPPSLSPLPLSSSMSSLASSPSSSPSPSPPSLLLSPSPSPSPLQSPLQGPPTSPSQVLAPVSPLTMTAGMSADPFASMFPPTTTDFLTGVSSLPPAGLKPTPLVTEPATTHRTVQPRPVLPPSPAPTAALSLGCTSSLPSALPTSGSLRVPESPSQAVSLQDSASSSPGLRHVFRSVTFGITSVTFSSALWNPASLEHHLLSEKVRDQLEPVYHEAFPSFEGISVLVFRPSAVHRPGSVAVNASLVFGDHAPGPTPCQVLWTLYRKVKAARQMLGNLSLAENSLASDGSTLTDLALETVSIRFTAMQPFLSQFLVPGSAAFALLEERTLRQVTPVVSGFYKVHPQEGPLLLFSNADQWVDVYIEYKFQDPVPTHLRGLANHLAWNVLDPTLQKSSILANGEKAQLVLYEVWLKILGRPFTKALKDKTSTESQELRDQLTRGLTTVLRHLQNLVQVVVEEFQPDPLTARVAATFFRAAPAEALVQDCVRQGLHTLWEAEGLSVEMVIPDLDTPSSGAPGQSSTSIPSYAVALMVLSLLITLALVLVLKQRACCRVFSLGNRKPHPQSSRVQ